MVFTSDLPLPYSSADYTLWITPFNTFSPKKVIVTENVPLNQGYVKLKSLYGDFWLFKGDYLNFQGKFILVKETTFITTNETILPIYNKTSLQKDDFTSTLALTLIASEASSSLNNSYEVASTTNKKTGRWSRKAVVKRDLDISFQGALIVSDQLHYYCFKRQQYYLELRNPIYYPDRLNTFMGLVEGIVNITEDKLVTLNGQLLPNKKIKTWELIGYTDNVRYCPTLPFYDNFHNPSTFMDTANYCSLNTTGFFDTPYVIIYSEGTANYCPLDTSIFN